MTNSSVEYATQLVWKGYRHRQSGVAAFPRHEFWSQGVICVWIQRRAIILIEPVFHCSNLLNMAKVLQCLVIWCFLVISALAIVGAAENSETENTNEIKNETNIIEISPDVFKKVSILPGVQFSLWMNVVILITFHRFRDFGLDLFVFIP